MHEHSRLVRTAKPVAHTARYGFEILSPPLVSDSRAVKKRQPLISNHNGSMDTLVIVKPQPYGKPALPKQQQSQVLVRRFVSPQVQVATVQTAGTQQPAKHRRSKVQLALMAMAFLVFGLGLLVNIQTIQTNHSAKAQVSALEQKTDNSENNTSLPPSEVKPPESGMGSYQVAPNLPKYLKIPKLSVSTLVKPLGVTSSNELKAPANIYDTGWYDASAHPGDPGSLGAVLIDGHVHGPTLPGVFANIKKLVAGDTIEITRGDNQVFTYKVVKVQNYDASTIDMGMMLSSVQPGLPGLNLITCGGPFDRKSGEYTQRTAVFAVQV